MSKLITTHLVRAQLRLRDLLAARERGADALEYVGMVIVAAVVVAAVVAVINTDAISGTLEPAMQDILGAEGGSDSNG
ncbi:MAG: hypothetical protein ACK5LN_09420 [Propioniciclava sp.]